ncbi:MAG: nuclear transport factor 2 family protein [Cyclobacteriaceae bacterium]
MLRKTIVSILLIVVFLNQGNAQTKANFEAINAVWYKFYQSFASLDYQPMAEIHSKRLVRISGGKKILDYETYISNYKTMFREAKQANETNEISLRFFERINNDSVASERGVYQLIRNKGQQSEQIYYGQFHVIMIQEDGEWKIFMDYDSSEGNTIGEQEYTQAHEITDYGQFK